MLFEGSELLIPLEVLLLVDVVVGVLGVPVWIAEGFFLLQVFLWSPELLAAVWILLSWEWTSILRDVHLILRHHVMDTVVHFVLEEGVGNTEIIVWLHSNWQLTWNRIPWVLVHFPDWCTAEGHHGHLIVGCSWPKDLHLFSLRVGHDLSGKVSLIALVEHIDTVVDDKVSEVNFFFWGQTELLNSKSLLTGETWRSPHQLLDVGGLRGVVPRAPHVTNELLDIFHGEGAIVWWDWTTLSHWMDVAHVVDGAWWSRVVTLDNSVVVLSAASKAKTI